MKEKKKIDYFMIVLIVIFLIVSYCYFQLAVQKKDYINLFGFTFFRVITGSMEDTISVNDIVIVKITQEDIGVKDIISYKSKNNIITHRVVTINSQTIITQGDANNTPDSPINREEIIGRVIFIIPVTVTIKVFTSPEVVGSILLAILIVWVVFHKKKVKK